MAFFAASVPYRNWLFRALPFATQAFDLLPAPRANAKFVELASG
jgi:hypothetical protein